MTPRDAMSLVAYADMLCGAAQGGPPRRLLLGKNLGLLSPSENGEEAERFRGAATQLGAQVAYIRPDLMQRAGHDDLLHTARVLGRLYAAVECQGLAPALVRQLGRDSGVPFFDGIATAAHPSARLATRLNGEAPLEDKRRFIVQAILLATIG
jgi:ornithine carbamoyltransferase